VGLPMTEAAGYQCKCMPMGYEKLVNSLNWTLCQRMSRGPAVGANSARGQQTRIADTCCAYSTSVVYRRVRDSFNTA
jgi:hypothetical protein